MSEKILVIERTLFDEIGSFQGWNADTEPYLRALSDNRNWLFEPKRSMEEDPNYKQPIPYVILETGGTLHPLRLFSYTRARGGDEARLHDLLSLGIGGHINEGDLDPSDGVKRGLLHNALFRELSEEVTYPHNWRMDCVGIINDDETEVGKVHLGYCFLMHVDKGVKPKEKAELADAGFVNKDVVLEKLDQYEPWSKIAIEGLQALGKI